MTTGAAAAIVYPETDGMPLPDGEYQAPIYVRVVSTLRVHFGDVPGARVNGDVFIYYVEGNPRRSVSPDCYVVFGLSEEPRWNRFPWKEIIPIFYGRSASRRTSSWR